MKTTNTNTITLEKLNAIVNTESVDDITMQQLEENGLVARLNALHSQYKELKALDALDDAQQLALIDVNAKIKGLKKNINDALAPVNKKLVKKQLDTYALSSTDTYTMLHTFYSVCAILELKCIIVDGAYCVATVSRLPKVSEVATIVPDFSTKLLNGAVNILLGDIIMWSVSNMGYTIDKKELKTFKANLSERFNLENPPAVSMKSIKGAINNVMGYLYPDYAPFATKATFTSIQDDLFVKTKDNNYICTNSNISIARRNLIDLLHKKVAGINTTINVQSTQKVAKETGNKFYTTTLLSK